jgi:hypothetical protein
MRRNICIHPGQRITICLPNGRDRLLILCEPSGKTIVAPENCVSARQLENEGIVKFPKDLDR